MAKSTRYKVYALVLEGKPVYIGMTTNITRRVEQHRQMGKIFNSTYTIESLADKKQALAVERTLIKFISAFGHEVYNTQDFFGLYYKQENINNG
jgi:predicted GIY-YIG superfamily endonuclease